VRSTVISTACFSMRTGERAYFGILASTCVAFMAGGER